MPEHIMLILYELTYGSSCGRRIICPYEEKERPIFNTVYKNFKRLPPARVCVESSKTWAKRAHAVRTALMDGIQTAGDHIPI